MSFLSYIPVIGQVEALARLAVGDKKGFRKAANNAINSTSYIPILGHVQAATAAGMGHHEEAKKHLCRSTGGTAALAMAVVAAPVAAAGAGMAATSMGIAGATGGVGSGIAAASATGAAASVTGKAYQSGYEHATRMKKSNREASSSNPRDWIKEASLGAVGGAVGGSVLGKASAGVAQQGLAGFAAGESMNAIGVHGSTKWAVKKTAGMAAEKGLKKALR